MRPIRCRECGERFYAYAATDTCQNCTGEHADFEQAQRDAELVRNANKSRKLDKPQSVDPRNPQVPSKAQKD